MTGQSDICTETAYPSYRNRGMDWWGGWLEHRNVWPDWADCGEILERPQPDREMLSETIGCDVIRLHELLNDCGLNVSIPIGAVSGDTWDRAS